MKYIITLALGLLFVLAPIKETSACEIDFEILKGKKEIYNVGDTIVVFVKVVLTHRSCPEAIKKTKFEMNGMKVIKSTPWKQTSSMDFERKLMIVITGTEDGKLMINAIRTCDKDGGFGSLKLEAVKP